MSVNPLENPDVQKGYALGYASAKSLEQAVRTLAERVNEHTALIMAMMKKFGTNPEELMATLTADDFLNPEEQKNVDGNENGTLLVS